MVTKEADLKWVHQTRSSATEPGFLLKVEGTCLILCFQICSQSYIKQPHRVCLLRAFRRTVEVDCVAIYSNPTQVTDDAYQFL